MMQLTEKEKTVFERIDFYNRYEALGKKYSFEKSFEKYSNEEVLKVIGEFGYKARYMKSDNYFKITDKENSFEFNLHFILKYGRVEEVMESKNQATGEILGGLFAMICKLTELSKGIDRDRYMAKPEFRDYEDLRGIFKEIFSIYDDFKREVIKQNE
jgi:hypothetical protein